MELSKKEIIIRSWDIMKDHLGLMVIIVLFLLSLNIMISIVQDRLLGDITYQSILFIIAAYLFQMGLNLGMLRICLNMINNEEVNFFQLFNSFHMLIPYALATILYIAALLFAAAPGLLLLKTISMGSLSGLAVNAQTMLSTIIMIVPAIYLSVRLQFYEYFLIDEECGIIESIKKSAEISKGYVLELFIIGSILVLFILISIIPMGLGLIFTIPLSTVVMSYVYLKLNKNH